MLQQINLYQYLPKKPKTLLSTKLVIRSYVAFIALLFFFYLISLWDRHSLNTQLEELSQEMAVSQQKLNVFNQKYPITDIATLKKNIVQLHAEYADQANTIDLLSHYNDYSNYLIGLGNAIVPGVWLTEIQFNREEIKMELRGYALQPQFLEQFFIKLTTLPAFSHLKFKVNEVKQTSFPTSFYITAKRVYE